MEENLRKTEKKFVDMMLKKSEESKKIKPESKADLKDVEKLTDSIRRRIQKGEIKLGE